jgi:hypothetical protein
MTECHSSFTGRLDTVSNLTLRIYFPPELFESTMAAVGELTEIVGKFYDCLQHDDGGVFNQVKKSFLISIYLAQGPILQNFFWP